MDDTNRVIAYFDHGLTKDVISFSRRRNTFAIRNSISRIIIQHEDLYRSN